MAKWQVVHICMNKEAAEAAYAILEEFGAAATAVEDPDLLSLAEEQGWGDYFPDQLGSVNPGQIIITCYFADYKSSGELEKLRSKLNELGQFGIEPGQVSITVEYADEEDWSTAWKAYYHTTRLGRVVIQPSWEAEQDDFPIQADDIVIQLDPGMAFGTGTHPTTAMCISALQELGLEGKTIWDVGTGSGVLSITAAKLGARVQAVDIDSTAVRVASENRNLNKVDFPISQGSLSALEGTPDVIVANIVADVILLLLPDAAARLKPGGLFIAGGVIEGRGREVEEKAAELGLKLLRRQQEQEWIGYTFQKEHKRG